MVVTLRRVLYLLLLVPLIGGISATIVEAQHPRALDALAMGDTGIAVTVLRSAIRDARPSAADLCLLATVLARIAPSRPTDWAERVEAERLFERALSMDFEPLCLLEFSTLKSRQGMRVDASRLAARALEMIRRDSTLQTPTVMAELYYRQALPLLAWVRQFDHLVFMTDVAVSTPACVESGFFCEAYAHPDLFFERLAERPRLGNLVTDERSTARRLLDSALRYQPAHPGAQSAAQALAASEGDWTRFLDVAARAHTAAPLAMTPLLGLMTAEWQRGGRVKAVGWFDSIQTIIGPDATARFEGLALIADTSLRDRLAGDSAVVYAEAVWGLSDPMYLTAVNERRLEHYVRVYLAEVLFTDPESGRPGRETPQGQLVIRYGLPAYVFVLKADQRLKLTPSQLATMNEITECSTQPIIPLRPGDRSGGEAELPCAYGSASGQPTSGGGRWEFWYYARGGTPFVFERALGSWTARHMFNTSSLHLDSLLHGRMPSVYQPPNRDGTVRSLVTRFPRPRNPAIEVWGTFEWPAAMPRPRDPVRLGVFVHHAATGKLVGHAVLDRRPLGATSIRFDRSLPAVWGPLQIAVEGTRFDRDLVSAQQRHRITLLPPSSPDSLWLSDLLIGDSAQAPLAIASRQDVRMYARPDSVVRPRTPLALYWELYGMRSDSAGSVRYTVQVSVERQGGGVVATVGRFLGLSRTGESATSWEVHRPAAEILPDVLVLEEIPDGPSLTISVVVTDRATGRQATSRRVVATTPR